MEWTTLNFLLKKSWEGCGCLIASNCYTLRFITALTHVLSSQSYSHTVTRTRQGSGLMWNSSRRCLCVWTHHQSAESSQTCAAVEDFFPPKIPSFPCSILKCQTCIAVCSLKFPSASTYSLPSWSFLSISPSKSLVCLNFILVLAFQRTWTETNTYSSTYTYHKFVYVRMFVPFSSYTLQQICMWYNYVCMTHKFKNLMFQAHSEI